MNAFAYERSPAGGRTQAGRAAWAHNADRLHMRTPAERCPTARPIFGDKRASAYVRPDDRIGLPAGIRAYESYGD